MESLSDLIRVCDIRVLMEMGCGPAPADATALTVGRVRIGEIFRLLVRILEQRDAPRAYIADLNPTTDEHLAFLGQRGLDELSGTLSDAGIMVVDAETIRSIFRLRADLPEVLVRLQNPYFGALAGYGLVKQLYVPADALSNDKNKSLLKTAKEKGIDIVTWQIAFELVVRAPRST